MIEIARDYQVSFLVFSPDCTKLAVAQTDNVIYIYKLGLDWGEKKSICNKFIQNSDITGLSWPASQANVIFGLTDGRVRLGNLKTNKSATLYQIDSPCISLTNNIPGTAVLSGHLDGTLAKFYFDDGVSGAVQGKFVNHSCAPLHLAWSDHVMVAGCDRNIVFYDDKGNLTQTFDHSRDDDVPEFGCCQISPSGACIVLGGYDRIHVLNYSAEKHLWEEMAPKLIENMYTVSALSWKPDGSRLVVGNMTSAVELYDCCLRRSKYRGKFEFNYITQSQVIVKRLSTGSRIVLKSHYGYEIYKVNIFQDKYLVANTSETILLGDLASCKLSEVFLPYFRFLGKEAGMKNSSSIILMFA